MLMMDNSRVLGESALVRVRIHFQRVKGRYVFYWGGGWVGASKGGSSVKFLENGRARPFGAEARGRVRDSLIYNNEKFTTCDFYKIDT